MKICDMKTGEIITFSKPKKYEFVKILGSGGTGQTILMQDATINNFFVCKKYVPQQKEYTDAFYTRFVDEIKIMYSLFDPHIVRIFDYHLYPEEKTGFIIMEYVNGHDIDEYFKLNEHEHINSFFFKS